MNRIRETTLLGADLLGGWPGGFAAQRKLRHKIQKRKWRFQAIYWGIVLLWQWVTLEIVTGGILVRLLREQLGW